MRKTIGSLATVAAAIVLTFAVLPITSASAGSNGQQVSVCAAPWSSKAIVEGSNQDGVDSREYLDIKPGLCRDGWNVTWNWWWKGDVTISLAGDDGNYWFQSHCNVPGWQQRGADTYRC
jgi:hypothetical protein